MKKKSKRTIQYVLSLPVRIFLTVIFLLSTVYHIIMPGKEFDDQFTEASEHDELKECPECRANGYVGGKDCICGGGGRIHESEYPED